MTLPSDHPPPADSTPDAPAERLAHEDAFLLEYLSTNEAPCPACGYNLHALTNPRCPECGRAIRLMVVPRIPRMRAWMAMVTTTAASAGVGALFTLIHPPSRFESPPASWARGYFYAAIPLVIVLVLARRPITRLPPTLQWSAALFLSLLSLVALAMAIVML